MNRTPSIIGSCVVFGAIITSISAMAAIGTGFTYQGQLRLDGNPVNSLCTFTFKLFDAVSAGTQVGGTLSQSFNVNGGQFTTQLDFGSVFLGDARWLEIAPNCGAGAVTLSPRQALTPTPYALFASTANTASTSTSATTATTAVSAASFTGPLVGDVNGLQGSTSVVALRGTTLSATAPANGQVLQFNGTSWGPGTASAGGVTSISATAPLSSSGSAAPNISLTGLVPVANGGTGSATLNFWTLGGNGGTNPATQFLGTADNTALELRVNGARSLRLEPNAASPNLIGGYSGNSVTAGVVGATISGGGTSTKTNRVTDDYNFVGGGYNNQAGDSAGTTSDASFATVAGGANNTANGPYTTVSGGLGGFASGSGAAVSGGFDNVANGNFATVGGGATNAASNRHATVGGGTNNTASGVDAVVGGGVLNVSSGPSSTVPGGLNNMAQGISSFATGQNAQALNNGSFVWNDTSTTGNPFSDSKANEFNVRASGGVRIFSSSDYSTGCFLAAGGTSWNCTSDRNAKENFEPVASLDILTRLAAVPIQNWNSKAQDPTIRHIGPMAQDFYAAFNLGEDDRHISTGDAAGIAFAAIQGLYEISQEKDVRIQNLERENATSKTIMHDLNARLAALERLMLKP